MRITKAMIAEHEKQIALTRLRELLPIGSVVYGCLAHQNASGYKRSYSMYALVPVTRNDDTRIEPSCIDHLVAVATGFRRDAINGGIICGSWKYATAETIIANMSFAMYKDEPLEKIVVDALAGRQTDPARYVTYKLL